MQDTISKHIHTLFSELPVSDTCTWDGTEVVGTGRFTQVMPCGEPTVGAGLFCLPGHTKCQYHSICERHKQPLSNWI
jgi:hypothetical protein